MLDLRNFLVLMLDRTLSMTLAMDQIISDNPLNFSHLLADAIAYGISQGLSEIAPFMEKKRICEVWCFLCNTVSCMEFFPSTKSFTKTYETHTQGSWVQYSNIMPHGNILSEIKINGIPY